MRTLEIGTPGAMRDRLNQLILEGTKRATAGLVVDYEREGEELECTGETLALVDNDGHGIATVTVTRVVTTTFGEVPWEFAQSEGEGDTSIEEWRAGHRRFWTAEGEVIDESTRVVLVWFRLADPAQGRPPAQE
jgi:uncharacterized protein YhfF